MLWNVMEPLKPAINVISMKALKGHISVTANKDYWRRHGVELVALAPKNRLLYLY